jgi:hypothetical protein
MVGVSVGHQNVGDPLARLEGGQDVVDVGVERRSRVNDRNFATADDVGTGAAEGERIRVLADDSSYSRCDLID